MLPKRKAVFDTLTADGTSTTLALKKIRRPNSSRRFRKGRSIYVVTSPYCQSPGRRSRKLRRATFKERLTPGICRDYTLKPHSLTRITVSGYQKDINVVLDGAPSMVSTYRNGKSDVWVTNLQSRNKSSEECA
ncbi:hypothetical protein TNCV_1819701 [Trichonephila clavipes]|nr:hypothetical protein TNCV_1819701 [Trichonephila clavipes]